MVTYITTPSSPRRVSFMPIPIYSRLPHDDELYVMKAFEKHASHCPSCADPLRSHRDGYTLCAKGHAYAADVAQYVYNKEGLAYSLVDRKAHQRVRLEVPSDCKSLRKLLRAWECGMKLMQAAKPERRHSRETTTTPVIETRRPSGRRGPVYPGHRSTASIDSSDNDMDYAAYEPYSADAYYQPEEYVPSRRRSVFYRVVPPSSLPQPIVIYPR